MAFATNGDTRLYYEALGEGDAILLITGLGGASEHWGEDIRDLAATHKLILVDPRGAGRSDKPDVPYTGDLLAEDMRAILDDAGVERAHVVGISMGGMIGQELAIRHPGRVQSLMLVSTYAATDSWSRRIFEIRRLMIDRLGFAEQFRMAMLFVFSPRTFRDMPDVVSQLEEGFAENPPELPAYLRQLQFCTDHDATERLGQITAPTLVVTGADDLLTTTLQGRDLTDLIPQAECREIPDASHLYIYEQPAGWMRPTSPD